jgi:hypothetical protein
MVGLTTKRVLSLGLLILAPSFCAQPEVPYYFHPSGIPGEISDVQVEPVRHLSALPSNFVATDTDLQKMAAWSLRYLNRSPRPQLDYEPVFYVRPLKVPPAPAGHDPIVPGDTDARMDWEYRNMRAILGQSEPGEVEQRLHARVLRYLHADGLAWVPPGHYMEGDVYAGTKVGSQDVVSTWASAKILRSLSEDYKLHPEEATKASARKIFVALRNLASWDSGRAYYPFGSGAWLNGKWLKPQVPTAVVEPIVTYWEATGDAEALAFARSAADGLMADAELLPPDKARILPDGEFHGHMHTTLHGVWGVAHLGAATHDLRYTAWAKQVYDRAAQFGPGSGWMQAALWDDSVRELSETCASSDMMSIASLLAQSGFPEYWDHVERDFRNYIRTQQFFVTPQYERLYREVNKDERPAAVEAGVVRMRDLQGADMGGPGPNDWINWIAGAKQCGPYATPYGCMGMFGCCAPEGMRALHTTWLGIIGNQDGKVIVNESLSRSTKWADVVSSLPEQGRIDVIARSRGEYWLRPPSWAPRREVRLLRNGKEMKELAWDGPALAYVKAANVQSGETLTLAYPIVRFKQVWGNWPSQPNLKLTVLWAGNSILDMTPHGKGLPIDFAHPHPVPDIPQGSSR